MISMWRWFCFIQFAILLIIYTFLGLTGEPGNFVPVFNDKLMHSGGYFVAAFSISLAFPRKRFDLRAFFLIAYSIGIEIGQHFMPPRTFDVFDIVANSTGVIVGLSCVYLLEKYLPPFQQLLHLKEQ